MSERDALYGPEPGASEAWADMATPDSHSGVPVEGPDWNALEREWLDATPPAGHPLIHGIFQRLPNCLAPFLAAAAPRSGDCTICGMTPHRCVTAEPEPWNPDGTQP